MRNQRMLGSTLAALLLTAGAPAKAQPSSDMQFVAAEAYGPNQQILWVPGSHFAMRGVGTDAEPAVAADGLVAAPGTNKAFYHAPLELPPGAVLNVLVCFARDDDADALDDVVVAIHRYTYSFGPPPVLSTNLVASVQTTGAPGLNLTSNVVFDHTVRGFYTDAGNQFFDSYHLVASLGANLYLWGCEVIWHRAVSEAPAVATFTDIPLGDTRLQVVEAVAAAGIMTGCGGGNFCPQDPVTRAQLALFFARALGLHEPF
jgi:S-layer family protein